MNTDLYKCSHNLMIIIHRKFNDDICSFFLVIMNNFVVSFIKEYRRPTLRPPLYLRSIEAGISISKFWKRPPFWSRDKLFLPEVMLEVEYTRKIVISISDILSLYIDALAQILIEIYQFKNFTYFETWWRHRWRHECVKQTLHNQTSLIMYMQNIVCVAPVPHS